LEDRNDSCEVDRATALSPSLLRLPLRAKPGNTILLVTAWLMCTDDGLMILHFPFWTLVLPSHCVW
jgi:hypothetical protein